MAQSFTKRFAGREREVVDEIKLLGWNTLCEHEGIAGYGLQGWFQKQKGCENDSIYHYISSDLPIHNLPLAKQIMLAIQKERSEHTNNRAKDEAIRAKMAREIQSLREQLRYYRLAEYRDLKPIWELCQQLERETAIT